MSRDIQGGRFDKVLTVKFIICDENAKISIQSQLLPADVHVETVLVEDGNLSEIFNKEFLKTPRASLYGFFLKDDEFINSSCLNKILDKFDKNETGALYSDKFIIKNNNLIPQFYPPYESDSKFVYNPTLFINGGIKTEIFDSKLEHLRFYDALNKIGTASKVIHIPQILIKSKMIYAQIDKELEYVWKTN